MTLCLSKTPLRWTILTLVGLSMAADAAVIPHNLATSAAGWKLRGR